MKKYWIEYCDSWKNSPLAFWVHIEVDNKNFFEAEVFDPPSPKKTSNGKYKIYSIEYGKILLRFSSIYQYTIFIDTLSKKLLPISIDLSKKRTGILGPNSHWLSKLSGEIKSWNYRKKLIKYLLSIQEKLFRL